MAGEEMPPKMMHNIPPILRSPFESFFLAVKKVKIPEINERMPIAIILTTHGNTNRIQFRIDPLYAAENIPTKRYIGPSIVDSIAPINVNVSAVSTLFMLITLGTRICK